MNTYLPPALADVPGSPTYADVIFISLGINDHLLYAQTPEQYYTSMALLRSNMISEGWWVPGTTQIVLMDVPRNGIMGSWNGIDLVRSRFNDRISYVNSVNAQYLDEVFDVHYTPATLTNMGRLAGEMVFEQIPWQQSVFSVGGTRLSIGGQKLRVHAQ